LEGSNARILDFVEVLNPLGHIDQQIGSSGIGAETPDLAGISNIPAVFISEDTSTELELVARVDLATLDGLGELLIDWQGLDEETIVLVLRF